MDPHKITIETYNKVAESYQDRFMDFDFYNDTYDDFCELIKPNASIFEIACGPGNITRYILSKKPDLEIEAIDLASNMIKLARINNPTVKFEIMDSREIHRIEKKFDAIICGFCMPYLSNEECNKLIKDCADLLPANGIFYFSTMEGEDSRSGFETASSGDQVYIYYHQESYLTEKLMEHGFELLNLKRKEFTRHNGETWQDMIFIVRKS